MALNITTKSVLDAMAYIDKNGVPPNRENRSISVCKPNSNIEYPAKYVCEIAHNSVNSKKIKPCDFISHEAARALKNLGFKVIGFKK